MEINNKIDFIIVRFGAFGNVIQIIFLRYFWIIKNKINKINNINRNKK